jgi:acyl-CoA thioester hydrolase
VADAAAALLGTLGLAPAGAGRARRAWRTDDCYVRYHEELRVGDLAHAASGVLRVERDALTLGHRFLNSATGALCTTVEHRLRRVAGRAARPAPLTARERRAAAARLVAWDGPPRERRPRPAGVDGFHDSARDTIKAWEVDATGAAGLHAYVHRFSAANGHTLAAFGMTPAYQREARRGFSTFEFQLGVERALRADDAVAVRSALLHVGSSSMRLLHVMLDARRGARVATLEQLGVHLDMDARRPVPLPDALRDRARALLVPPAGA